MRIIICSALFYFACVCESEYALIQGPNTRWQWVSSSLRVHSDPAKEGQV